MANNSIKNARAFKTPEDPLEDRKFWRMTIQMVSKGRTLMALNINTSKRLTKAIPLMTVNTDAFRNHSRGQKGALVSGLERSIRRNKTRSFLTY